MAEEIACPACDTPNDPWNELCEACGAELHADAPVQDDATDGEDFVEPDADGGDPGGFEDVEEVQAYDEANPDYGVDDDITAEGEEDLAEIPVEGYELAEDTGADDAAFPEDQPARDQHDAQPTEAEYELEPIEPEDEDEEAGEDDWYDEPDQPQDDQFDGDAPLDGSPDDTFDSWEDDEVAADGGAPFDAEQQFDAAGEAFASDEFAADESAAESNVGFDDDFEDFDADREADFDDFEQFDAQGNAEHDQEFAGEESEQAENEQADSEVEEEPPPPPELEEILNPKQVDRTPIEPLPTPGPYAELATLTVLRGGEELGEVAIDFNCTVLGLDQPDDASQDELSEEDDAEELYELDEVEPVELDADEAAFEDEASFEDDDEPAYELEPIEEEPVEEEPIEGELIEEEAPESFDLDEPSELEEESALEEDFGELDAMVDSEAEEEPQAPATFEDPDDLEEGPVIDLSQFGDEARFARRHGYLFRQNKHYTLYVLSDMGTQVNDELLELGEYRELDDGDVIVLGGEVALKFNKPAA